MDLLPDSKAVEFTSLTSSGVVKKIVPLSQIRPILWDDFSYSNKNAHTFPDRNLDLEMIYENIESNEVYLFEFNGEWKDEGVNNEAFSLENNFNERVYFNRETHHIN